jgi:glycosyltransferase involved in cell wall biosynthesis
MEAEQYRKMGVAEDKIEIVPNAINMSDFANLPEKGKFKQKHGFGDEKLVLFLGRLAPVKGVDLLVRAFARLLDEMKDARLVIVGPDEGCLADLKDLVWELKIEDRVLFPGALYGVEKLEAYVDAHVYVLPSVYEIFGITMLEALACKTPVIVTDRCGIADKIDGRAGIVVPRNEQDLKEALKKMLTDDEARRQFVAGGRKLIEEEFTWQKVAAKMESVYHSARGAK